MNSSIKTNSRFAPGSHKKGTFVRGLSQNHFRNNGFGIVIKEGTEDFFNHLHVYVYWQKTSLSSWVFKKNIKRVAQVEVIK
jgi:hypothetical protein